ncbi:MAG: ABC transporter permease subunit [Mariprofundaceae bacterium]|nr:ABC transporter permease subunit [Mariprofundaceae bacterium]
MKQAIQCISAVAQLTFLDGLRKQTLLGLIVLALLLECSGIFFMDFFGHDIGRASSDFLLSVIWLAGLVFLFFHAVQTIALSEERKSIYMILSRPISRSQYVLGTFIGLASLLLILQASLGVVAWFSLLWIKTQLDVQYFAVFNHGYFVLSLFGLMLMQCCVLAIIMLFCGMLRGSFLVLMMSIAYYFICSSIPVVLEAVKQQISSVQEGDNFYYLLQGLALIFPDFSRLDFKDAILEMNPSLVAVDTVSAFVLSALYLVIVLTCACYLYSRRDL